MRLGYNGRERIETEADVIATLQRKGWVELPAAPPVFSPAAGRVERIRQRADDIIYGRYAQTGQNNMQARFSELLYLERQRSLTAEELAEQTALLAVYDWVRSVRTYAADLTAQAEAGVAVDPEAAWPMEAVTPES